MTCIVLKLKYRKSKVADISKDYKLCYWWKNQGYWKYKFSWWRFSNNSRFRKHRLLVSNTTFACAPVCRQSTVLVETPTMITITCTASTAPSKSLCHQLPASTRAGDPYGISDRYTVLASAVLNNFELIFATNISNCIDHSNTTFVCAPVWGSPLF